MKLLRHPAVFAVLYVVFLVPTYLLPYYGSNSAVTAAFRSGEINQPLLLHLGTLIILFTLAWYRGEGMGKQWLTVFPFLAGVFDIVPGLSLVPFVPTVLHLCTIILGVTLTESKEQTPDQPS